MKEKRNHVLEDFMRELLGSLSIDEVTRNKILSRRAELFFNLIARRA